MDAHRAAQLRRLDNRELANVFEAIARVLPAESAAALLEGARRLRRAGAAR
jgi:hypothetical protein